MRDSNGAFIFAFSIPLGVFTSFQAEVKALIFGVEQCCQQGYSHIHLGVDSLVLVNVLQDKYDCPGFVRSEIRCFEGEDRLVCDSGHCYREVNQVVDALSKVGA